ncbi:uncharacterized protein METZ01_LOCUS67749 [marine metagenome]|uniref:Uncharacterized protein n=1 Tax=marine metagenome TaxID=408172 RepID=A0A381TFI0_9ZZZZ
MVETNIASERSDLRRSDREKFALVKLLNDNLDSKRPVSEKSAPTAVTPNSIDHLRSAFLKTAPARFDSERLTPPRLASDKSVSSKLAWLIFE